MAAKATIQDILDAGFREAQFGTPPDWTDEDGYLARVLADASTWAQVLYGSGYDAVTVLTDPAAHHRLRQAELCYASGVLWKRRAAFIDSNAASALDNLVHADRREFEAQAARAFECAEDWLAQAIGGASATPGSTAVLAHAESGPFMGPARCLP